MKLLLGIKASQNLSKTQQSKEKTDDSGYTCNMQQLKTDEYFYVNRPLNLSINTWRQDVLSLDIKMKETLVPKQVLNMYTRK
jgi:hypothetical protein